MDFDFVSKGQEDKVCCLKISMNDLKQSFRAWYFRFHKTKISFSLSMVLEDHFVYVKKIIEGFIFLTLYVDDMLLAENYVGMIQTTKK